MKEKPDRALTQVPPFFLFSMNYCRNEGKARQGIDTHFYSSLSILILVEMKEKPDRALTQDFSFSKTSSFVSRNEGKARQGIDTISFSSSEGSSEG